MAKWRLMFKIVTEIISQNLTKQGESWVVKSENVSQKLVEHLSHAMAGYQLAH